MKLSSIQYSEHNWNLCGYLKVVSLLLGCSQDKMCCCLICEWDKVMQEFDIVGITTSRRT